ncbi:hypothetical protein NG697_12560 [Pseudarthrobacter sp. MDT3-26]|nr:hypothetical protein [Pseudarthrobacter sp. MDT3-26]MCO4263744.1 hypothetical protein [Pseudarthrobacter sp. MDT3-26]
MTTQNTHEEKSAHSPEITVRSGGGYHAWWPLTSGGDFTAASAESQTPEA